MKIHLGCGSNYINGWMNIDLDSPLADIKVDLIQPLELADNSADFIFSEHFIEHITHDQGLRLLAECRRILKPEGVMRISTPDLKFLAQQYLRGRLNEWVDMGWAPKSPCLMMNEGMRLWGHQFLYDLKELEKSLRATGFSRIREVKHRKSKHVALSNLECRPWHREVILEASL